MDVDYVVTYRFVDCSRPSSEDNVTGMITNLLPDKSNAIPQFERLLQSLAAVGLSTEVRNGDKHSLLVFVKFASDRQLYNEVHRSR